MKIVQKILIINPGSSSTKVAVYEDRQPLFIENIQHSREELDQFDSVNAQVEFRRQVVVDALCRHSLPMQFDAIVSRGGLGKPVPGGAYTINSLMVENNMTCEHRHACNLGCNIALSLARTIPGCRALTANPAVVDERVAEARLTGLPQLPSTCLWHALNHKAVAARHARGQGCRYEDLNLIVCHLGGGISVASHRHGQTIDVNNALDGDGAFSNERAGSLPSADLVRLCFSGQYTEQQILSLISGKGGIMAYLGTNDLREVTRRIQAGDEQARLVADAMIFQIAKEICAQGAVLCGQVDAIILTGGMAHDQRLTDGLRQRVEWLAPVYCYPGEDEMQALADVGFSVLAGEMEAQEYR